MAEIYDDRPCDLGEGALWHPSRGQLFWFDILGRRLLTRTDRGPGEWRFPELVSAAGWIDDETLLVASESALSRFSLVTGASERIVSLEADNPVTRSNDGRADPWGGFWIGTMGRRAEAGAGAIYRYHNGELRRLFAPITIPNAISFTPDRRFAHFADTARSTVWRVALSGADGWPAGDPEVFLDLSREGRYPDGATCDAAGNLWVAEWGGARVTCFAPDGRELRHVPVGGRHSSCPAFGGEGLRSLFVTTARQDLTDDTLRAEPQNGCTFSADPGAAGIPEPAVRS
jgi:sugar lactone lactonase YvrE